MKTSDDQRPDKAPFDIDVAMARVREAVKPYPPAAMFQLASEGFTSAFEQVVACMISIRTYDEVSLPVARELFARARTPAEIAALPVSELDTLIRRSSFHEAKARQIQEIARRVDAEYGGVLPCDEAVIRSLPGVGPKCGNLVLGIACSVPRISVDVHVDRITNRWGYVKTTTPELSMGALEEKLPSKYWIEINRLLVPFGKHICTGRLPACSTCVLLEMCPQVGVTAHR